MVDLLTTLNPESQTTTGIPTYIYIAAAGVALATYMLASVLLRPVIIFKMKKLGTEEERSINYTVMYEIHYIYRYIPFLIYKKVYTAEFVSLDNPEEDYGQYNLPFDLAKLRASIESTYLELEIHSQRNNHYYDDAEELEIELQALEDLRNSFEDPEEWFLHPEYVRHSTLRIQSRRMDVILDDSIDRRSELICCLRKKETVYKMYDPTYKRKPTYFWEFE